MYIYTDVDLWYNRNKKGGQTMNMQENYRLIEALESAGWTAQEIVNLIKYVESGEEQYKPQLKE
jgi:hypothetical protein